MDDTNAESPMFIPNLYSRNSSIKELWLKKISLFIVSSLIPPKYDTSFCKVESVLKYTFV